MIYRIGYWLRLSVKIFHGNANRHDHHQFIKIYDWILQGKPDPKTFTHSWSHQEGHKSRAKI